MQFQTIRDIIDFSKEVHAEIADRFANLSNEAVQERAKLLLDYLSRHELHLKEALQRYGESAAESLLTAWYLSAPELHPEDIVHDVELFADMDIDEVMAEAIKVDDYLIDIYRNIADNARDAKVRELSNRLLQMENTDKIKAIRNTLRIDA